MRIGILTQYYPPEIGAPQNRLSEIARQFVGAGHEVIVLTAMPNYPTGRIHPGYGGLYRDEVRDGIQIKRSFIFPTKKIGMLPRLLNYFSFVLSSTLIGAFRLPKLDYLVTESPPLFLGLSGFVLSRLKGAKLIFNVSDLWPESAVHMGLVRNGALLRLAWKLEAFCYRKAWLVSCQSREIQANIQKRFPKASTYFLSNGVDTASFGRDLFSRPLREELIQGRTCLALYAGLHGVAQGLDQVLEAATQLQDLPELLIVLVGDGPEKEALQERARKLRLQNVRFLPPYPHQKMPAILASADVALVILKGHLPGAVPSKIYEAMGSGVPVVLAADGEAARIIRETQAGLAVRPGDSAAIATVLRDLMQNPEKRRQMGENGREAALACFDRRKIARGFIDLLERRMAS